MSCSSSSHLELDPLGRLRPLAAAGLHGHLQVCICHAAACRRARAGRRPGTLPPRIGRRGSNRPRRAAETAGRHAASSPRWRSHPSSPCRHRRSRRCRRLRRRGGRSHTRVRRHPSDRASSASRSPQASPTPRPSSRCRTARAGPCRPWAPRRTARSSRPPAIGHPGPRRGSGSRRDPSSAGARCRAGRAAAGADRPPDPAAAARHRVRRTDGAAVVRRCRGAAASGRRGGRPARRRS